MNVEPCFSRGVDGEGNPNCFLPTDHSERCSDTLDIPDLVEGLNIEEWADRAEKAKAALDETLDALKSLQKEYRRAIGIPPSQHQRERMEQISSELEAAIDKSNKFRQAVKTLVEGWNCELGENRECDGPMCCRRSALNNILENY